MPEDIIIEGRVEIPQLQLKIPLKIEGMFARASVSGLVPGSYTAKLIFEAVNTDYGRVGFVEAEREVDIIDGPNTLSFQKTDYRYPDIDGDKYTNLVEIEYGTDPTNVRDAPYTARVFLASTVGTGDLSSWPDAGGMTGIAAGDAICQARADAAGLPGRFVAWLSDANHDAYCRVNGLEGKKSENCGQDIFPAFAGPWVRTDGFPFSPKIDEVVNRGVVYSPVVLDEFGRNWAASGFIWTGTNARGEAFVYQDESLGCVNWASADPEKIGVAGVLFSGAYTWTLHSMPNCDTQGRLLCFESPARAAQAPLPEFKEEGKLVFVTSIAGSGNLGSWPAAGGFTGIDAGDAICRNQARAGGLPNPQNYKAWLSGSITDAVDRLVSNGPWVRPDGVLVARNKSDLVDWDGIFTSISINENLEYFTQFINDTDNDVWTGTDSFGRATGMHCNDWTSGEEQHLGDAGIATNALELWARKLGYLEYEPGVFELECSKPLRLFCFEDDQ